MREFSSLKDFFKRHKWRYILGVVWLLATDMLQMATPRLLGNFTDAIQAQGASPAIIRHYALLIILVAAGVAAFRFLWRIYIIGSARKLDYYLRDKFFRHLQTLSPSYFNHHKTGDLMAHATNDITAVRSSLGIGIVMLVDAIFLTITTTFLMFTTIDSRLTIISLLPLPLLAVLGLGLGKAINTRFGIVQSTFSRLSERVQENISGIRVVKAFSREKSEINKISGIAEDYVIANMNLIRVWGLFDPMVMFLSSVSFTIALIYGGSMVIQGTIPLGSLVAFITYLEFLTWPMLAAGWVINMIQRGSASLKRLNTILHEKPDIEDNIDEIISGTVQGKIEIENLTFAYPKASSPALKNINLLISPGETLAIFGPTGSGKTTIVNLLLRLYNPPRGTLFIDGREIYTIPLAELRESFGYVPQDNFLFSKTISENIAFGRPGAARENIENAAKTAHVYDNIIDFPRKFDTILGERGVTLSGGQKQRISIARALIKVPPILILDDALSAVDTQTEEAILQKLNPQIKTRTSIIISHRISTIKTADQIIVLQEGQIIEQGTHWQLIRRNGYYADLYRKQQLEDKLAQGK